MTIYLNWESKNISKISQMTYNALIKNSGEDGNEKLSLLLCILELQCCRILAALSSHCLWSPPTEGCSIPLLHIDIVKCSVSMFLDQKMTTGRERPSSLYSLAKHLCRHLKDVYLLCTLIEWRYVRGHVTHFIMKFKEVIHVNHQVITI